MRRFAKWTAVFAVAFGGVAVASDFWRYSAYSDQLRADETVAVTLDESLGRSEERLVMKEHAVQSFLDRRLSFAQLVALFQQVNEGNDRLAQFQRDLYPAADDRELAARNAVQFILAGFSADSPARAAVLNRIRSDFDRQFPRAAVPSL